MEKQRIACRAEDRNVKRKIHIRLNDSSLERAINDLKAYKQRIEDKTDMVLKRLALLGFQGANVRFQTAAFEPDSHNFEIDIQSTETGGWKIIANGKDVCFIEFGAGVYYNGSDSYPGDRPPGIVGIGEYGKGKGKQEYWFYSQGRYTRGTPANAPMFYTAQEMRKNIMRIAREVFST